MENNELQLHCNLGRLALSIFYVAKFSEIFIALVVFFKTNVEKSFRWSRCRLVSLRKSSPGIASVGRLGPLSQQTNRPQGDNGPTDVCIVTLTTLPDVAEGDTLARALAENTTQDPHMLE